MNSARVSQNGVAIDRDVQIMYIVPDGKFYSKDQVYIKLSDNFNRSLLPDKFEQNIEQTWTRRLASNPKLWDGTKFRIESAQQESNSNGVTFNLGITSYKDFIGTNWSQNAGEYQELGVQDHDNSQAYMSDALGVGALVQTADDNFILLRRSQHCGEAVGLLDIPGGHPEPKELVGRIEASDIDLESLSPADVLHEIFESTLREIIDEVNIPKECLSYPQLMGIARNTTSAGRPSSEYFTRCSLTSREVQERYLQGDHEEADESTSIVFLPMSAITSLQQDEKIWEDLAPSAKGCILLYQLSCSA